MSSTYNELKNDIKCWERMFARQHHRKPTKNDIKCAPPEIYKCYKDYVSMKKDSSIVATGVDVFGSDLNKPKEVICEISKTENFVPITPNLRKKVDIKKAESAFVEKQIKDADLIQHLGFDESISIANDLSFKSSLPTLKSKSFLNNKKFGDFVNLDIDNINVQKTDSTVYDKENMISENGAYDLISCTNSNVSESVNSRSEIQTSDTFELFDESTSSKIPLSNIEDKGCSKVTDIPPSSLEINEALFNNDQPQKKKKTDTQTEVPSKEDDGNFVRLNMKNKKYRRPGKAMTGEAYKRKQWKSRGLFGKGPPKDWKNPAKKAPPPSWAVGNKSKPGKCFKCGEEGHWATKCTGKKAPVTKEITPEEAAKREELDFSSLDPMIRVGTLGLVTDDNDFSSTQIRSSPPLLDGSEADETVTEMLADALRDLGYSSFRPGQKEAVVRILQGKSTLLVLSTGSGKSLVYQLAAYLYFKNRSATTLVISPLISLMDDQIQSLPAKLPGKCIHSHMSAKQKQTLKEDISNNKVPLILLSPEALMAGSFGSLPRDMPPIGFVCIDEAHCLSSWSDNFRPAYLQVCDMLRTRYQVTCFLGLTATCTAASCANVCKFVGVSGEEGVIRGPVIRDNLYLTASADPDSDRALLAILQGDRFKDLGSIIVYCTRRQQCERIATLLRTTLPHWAPQEEELCKKGKRKRKDLENSTAESYHAGLTPSQRSRVQHHFMAGTLRVVCATVAFGMGLDKANVRSVIHYSMPKSFENYVQEIGRAGRDGKPAHCHIFVDSLGGDLAELSKHAHSNTVDRYSIQMLLKYIFKTCACATLNKIQKSQKDEASKSVDLQQATEKQNSELDELDKKLCIIDDDRLFDEDDNIDWESIDERVKEITKCPGHSVTFPIARLVQDVDVPEENIATMLTYLELAPTRSWIKVKRPVSATCYIQCYGGAAHLTALAQQATTVLAAMKFYSDPEMASNELEFPYIELAAKMGWDAYIVRRELRDLEKRAIPGFKLGVMVEFKDLSFHVQAPGNLSDDELDEVTEYLYKRIFAQKNAEIRRLKELHASILEVSATTHYDAAHEVDTKKDLELKDKILNYFSKSTEDVENDWSNSVPDLPSAQILSAVQRDIRIFVQKHHELPLRGRVVARIFQGISSPNYPATTWGRIKQSWRKHIDVDFDWMVRCATEEIASMRLKL